MLLTPERIEGIARDVRAVAALPDPVGEMIEMTTRPNGLHVGRLRKALGESDPDPIRTVRGAGYSLDETYAAG